MLDIKSGPVHWLENVDGDPRRVRTACGRFEWTTERTELLDENRPAGQVVTCLECLEAMADKPLIVEAIPCP